MNIEDLDREIIGDKNDRLKSPGYNFEVNGTAEGFSKLPLDANEKPILVPRPTVRENNTISGDCSAQ